MTKKTYQRYSSEFKSLALRRASEDGVTDKEICEDLGKSRNLLSVRESDDCGSFAGIIRDPHLPHSKMLIS